MSKDWKDNLQICSFRGIKFLIEGHSANFGRRIISHEFPEGEDPSNEDLGKKTRAYNLEGYIVANGHYSESDPRYICGSDYFEHRNKLQDASEKRGSGVLIHPYLGRMQVECQNLTISETVKEGGLAKLFFQFIESSDELPAVEANDSIADVKKSSSNLKDESLINFKNIYAIVETTKSGIQKIKNAINSVLENIDEAQKFCADVAQIGHDLSQMVKEFNNALERIIAFPETVSALFEASFASLSASIDGFSIKNDKKAITAAMLIAQMSGAMSSPNKSESKLVAFDAANDAKRIQAWARLANSKLNKNEILNTTALEANIQLKNKQIIELTSRCIALSYLSNCIVTAKYYSSDDIKRIKELLIRISDDILNDKLISNEMFASILKMQVSTVKALQEIENRLPNISIFKINKKTNTLCFLYDNFGDLNKENDLIVRNNIDDPSEISTNKIIMVAT